MYGEAFMIEGTSSKLMQRVVASKLFHKAEGDRFDTVMIQNEKNTFVQGETGNSLSFWFGKALAFIS